MLWNGKKQDKDNEPETQGDISNEINDEKIKEKSEEVNSKAKEYLKDKEKLRKLIEEAEEKAKDKEHKKGFVQETWDNLKSMFELLRAYIKGDYRNIPYASLLLIVGAILYFVLPTDAIPDFIPGIGYLDDAAVIGFTLKKVKDDVDKFLEWKKEQDDNEN